MMNNLLDNPVVQGGVAPFAVAAVLTFLFVALGGSRDSWKGLAVFSGFLVMIILTVGIEFDPLTSTRKIVLLSILSLVLPMVFGFIAVSRKRQLVIYHVFSIAAVVWVLWPVLARKDDIIEALTIGAMASVYVMCIIFAALALSKKNVLAAGAGVSVLGFTIGGGAMLGASALLGQMGIAFGAGAGAFLLVHLLRKPMGQAGEVFTFNASLVLALVGVASVIYAAVPWTALAVSVVILLLANIALAAEQNKWLKAVIWFALCMAIGLVSLYISYSSQGSALY